MKLKVKLFADGADKKGMLEMYDNPLISGFTTNPTLMKLAGIKDYKLFAQDILTYIKDKPISFEVFSDEFDEMEKQALEIASWADNIYVKIPITNTRSESSVDLINTLSSKNVKINVTAMMTVKQVQSVLPGLLKGPGGYVSVFAGRIADAGYDPLPVMQKVVDILINYPNVELICHIITATNSILNKLPTLLKDLNQFSLETVQMFYNDAKAAGYKLQ